MKRITPEAVIDAYIATGEPRSAGTYFGVHCGCCALGALYQANKGCRPVFIHSGKIADELGLDHEYCLNFSDGFESDQGEAMVRIGESGNEDTIGYLDGVEAAKAVQAHFSPEDEGGEAVEEAEEAETVEPLLA